MNKLIERIKAPTPSWALKLGLTLFTIGNGITTSGLVGGSPIISFVGVALTIASKIVHLWVDDNKKVI
jgi:hypothetical protein